MLGASVVLKHIKEVQATNVDVLPFVDFRVGSDDEDFAGLVASIQRHGLLQPIIVRPSRGESGKNSIEARFELVCGHRRYAACKKLGIDSIPAMVMDLDNREAFEIALVENVQKCTLNPVEEAEAFKAYVMKYGRGSVTRLAERICKSEEYVSHRLLMLGLPKPLLDRISRRLLMPSHAMELVWLEDEGEQRDLAKAITKYNLSLRQLRLVTKLIKVENSTVTDAVREVLRMRNTGTYRDARSAEVFGVPNKPWADSSQGLEGLDPDVCLSTLNRAILVIRSALVDMDALAEEDAGQPALKGFILKERQKVHGMLDELIQMKVLYKRRGFIDFPAS